MCEQRTNEPTKAAGSRKKAREVDQQQQSSIVRPQLAIGSFCGATNDQ